MEISERIAAVVRFVPITYKLRYSIEDFDKSLTKIINVVSKDRRLLQAGVGQDKTHKGISVI